MIERVGQIDNAAELREEDRRKVLEIRGDYAGDPAIREAMEVAHGNGESPFGMLQSIFNRHQEKSRTEERLDISDYLVVQFDNSRWKEAEARSSGMMQIQLASRTVVINDDATKEESVSHGFDLGILSLHCLLHEFGHAASHSSGEIIEAESGAWVHNKAGVSHTLVPARRVIRNEQGERVDQPDSGRKTVVFLEFLNEAINDEFAEEITCEFALASGYTSKSKLDDFYKTWRAPRTFHAQSSRLLRAIVRRICEETGADEGVARNALKRAAIQGLNLLAPGMDQNAVLDEVVKPGFTGKLRAIETSKQLRDFIAQYGLENFFERLINNAKFLVGHYGKVITDKISPKI